MDVMAAADGGHDLHARSGGCATPCGLNSNLGYYTNFVNLLDLAAMAVPAGFRPNGLPFGISLIGPAFSDEALLALGDRFHRAQTVVPGPALDLSPCPPGCIAVAVVGAHLSGQPLNSQLTERGAHLVRSMPHRARVPAVCAGRHDAAEAGAGARGGLPGPGNRGGSVGGAGASVRRIRGRQCRRRWASATSCWMTADGEMLHLRTVRGAGRHRHHAIRRLDGLSVAGRY